MQLQSGISESAEELERPDVMPVSVEENLYLLDWMIIFAKRKRLILASAVGFAALMAVVAFVLPNKYTAVTQLLPPQQNQSSITSMLTQLNPLAAALGKDMGLKTPSDVYVGMLRSRSVADGIIQGLQLQQVYKTKKLVDAREKLKSRTDITTAKDGIISIAVEDTSPDRAASIANEYVDQLRTMTQHLAITEAGQRRLFYEGQLETAKNNLSQAEVALKQTEEKTGLILPEGQARVVIESIAKLQAQIATTEVQLQRIRVFATDQNPQVAVLEQELSALRSQLEKAEHDQEVGNGRIQISTSQVPESGLEYIRRLRDVKYHEALFEMLAKQYEAAKLDESKEAAVIQVIDPAIKPEKKSGPARSLMVLGGRSQGVSFQSSGSGSRRRSSHGEKMRVFPRS